MKTIPIIIAVTLLSLSTPQARAAGPGGIERIATLDLRTTPSSPIAVLYLHRADLMNQQMNMTVDMNADLRALDKEVAYIAQESKRLDPARYMEISPEAIAEVLRKAPSVAMDPLRLYPTQGGTDVHKASQAKAVELINSIDRKRDALGQLKTMLESLNAEIKAMNKAACSCSENPKTPGGAAASGPCSCS